MTVAVRFLIVVIAAGAGLFLYLNATTPPVEELIYTPSSSEILHQNRGPLPGQPIVDPDNRAWLMRHDGPPLFVASPGDPEGFLYRGWRNGDGTRRGDQFELIEKLARHGGNGVYVQAVRSHGGDGDADENPWLGHDPSKGLNGRILDQWDGWFAEMNRHGIIVHFFFYDDAVNAAENLGWPLDGAGNLHPDERSFIHALVDRLEHHPNLIWVVMEEGQEIGVDWKQHISKIAEAIREADDHGHVIAAHQLRGNKFFHADDPNIDQFAVQGDPVGTETPAALHAWLLQAWRYADGAYSLNMSEDPHHKEMAREGDRRSVRLRSWAAAMAGAYVMVLGMDVDETPSEMLADLRRMQTFFEAARINRMAPTDRLALGDTEYVLTDDDGSYIAYTSRAQDRMGLAALSAGTYNLTWFSPESGILSTRQNVALSAGNHLWEIPAAADSELALYVELTADDSL